MTKTNAIAFCYLLTKNTSNISATVWAILTNRSLYLFLYPSHCYRQVRSHMQQVPPWHLNYAVPNPRPLKHLLLPWHSHTGSQLPCKPETYSHISFMDSSTHTGHDRYQEGTVYKVLCFRIIHALLGPINTDNRELTVLHSTTSDSWPSVRENICKQLQWINSTKLGGFKYVSICLLVS